ncbi:cytochrome P450 [Sphingorhabdus sp.]|uniref:cytochrome P450 n=1 Tax=Sphingorhabdus sp. TaxID=1902408 RepID=UPI0035B0229F|nr:cytochrome P450 [Sphingomonadaceae bacterium]
MQIPAHLAQTIVDSHAYAAGDPVDQAFRTIRAEMPLAVAEPEGMEPFWVVSRHADIMTVEKQPEIFHNGEKSTFLTLKEMEPMVRFITGGEPNLVRSLVSLDGQEHKDLRAVVFPSVTPKALRGLEEDIRKIAKSFVAQMLDKAPECDFATDVAFLYPLRVIMTVLGVPQEDEAFMLKLTQELFSSADPELNRDRKEVNPAEALDGLRRTMEDLEAYFGIVTEKFRANPTEQVNSLIANAKVNGEYLNRRQLMGYYIIAATAGHDTTSNTTAGAMWALAERPHLFAQLKADPSKVNAFVEESIRWVVPVKHFMRSAVQDTEVAGQQIKAGDWMMLSYQSANRDEAVFDDPYDYRIDREPNRQIAFGYGAHVCLGQHLARMEMRILWEELLPHLKSIELAGTPQRTISNFVCGPKHVPIRFTLN